HIRPPTTSTLFPYTTLFRSQLKDIKPAPVQKKVRDGDWILDSRCQVIATPGHTSGHISLYFPSIKSIITGDAAVIDNESLAIAKDRKSTRLNSSHVKISYAV